MRIKFLPVIVSCFIISSTVISCLGSEDEPVYSSDATIWSLELDTIGYGINYKFTIDQIGGRIFNMDSLPIAYKDSVKKILIKSIMPNYRYITSGDTLFTIADSLDLSRPIQLKTYAPDGVTTLNYTLEVRVHQQDPDSLQWGKKTDSFAGGVLPSVYQKAVILNDEILVYPSPSQFYHSPVADGVNWSLNSSVSGLPGDVELHSMIKYNDMLYIRSASNVVYISTNGSQWEEVPALGSNVLALITSFPGKGISGIIDGEDGRTFAITNSDATGWTTGKSVPYDFPTENISSTVHTTNTGLTRAVVVGKSAEGAVIPWFSYEGLNWADMATSTQHYIPAMNNPTIAFYDGKLYAYGGDFNAFYSSPDGILWDAVEKKVTFPAEFKNRGSYSTVIDADNFIWIIWSGSSTGANRYTDEVWRGRINRLGFKIQ